MPNMNYKTVCREASVVPHRDVPIAVVPWGFQKAKGIGSAEENGKKSEDVDGREGCEHFQFVRTKGWFEKLGESRIIAL